MKFNTLFLIVFFCFMIADPIAARIIRTEEATSLISTPPTTEEKQPEPSNSSENTSSESTEKTSQTTTKKTKEKKERKHKTQKTTHKKSKESSVHTEPKKVEQQPQAKNEATTESTGLLDAKIKAIQEESEKEIAAINAQREKKVIIIKRQEELAKLNEQQKALAEELAKLDDSKEKEPKEPEKTPVTTEWQLEQTAKFNRYSTELADTIAMGESDEAELQDFKQIFKDQQQWFDSTMTSTKYTSDEGYTAINDRNRCLSLLVTAQKRALPLLMKEVNMKKISKSGFDRLSALLLYNLNAQINDTQAWNKTVPEGNDALMAVVKDTLAEAKDPAFNKQTPAQKMLAELQKKLKATQDLIEARNKTVLELEMNIATNTERLEDLKKDLSEIETQKNKSESELKELQKKSADDISALKAEKAKVETELTQAQTAAKEAKAKLDAATADSTKTAQEKAELQTQSKDLSKKVEDLQDKKHSIEQNLDEEQHKRRELELQIEQAKFKQERTEEDLKKLTAENTKLDSVCKDLSDQVERKNKNVMELKLELERLRQKFSSHHKHTSKRSNKAIEALRDDFEEQIHELKIILLKQTNSSPEEIEKEKALFKAKKELEDRLEKELMADEQEEQETIIPQKSNKPNRKKQAEQPQQEPLSSSVKASNAQPLSTESIALPPVPTPLPTAAPQPSSSNSPEAAFAALAKVATEPVQPLTKTGASDLPSVASLSGAPSQKPSDSLPKTSSKDLPPVAALPDHLSASVTQPGSPVDQNKAELKKLEGSIKNTQNNKQLDEIANKLPPIAGLTTEKEVKQELHENNKKELDELTKKVTRPGNVKQTLPPPPVTI